MKMKPPMSIPPATRGFRDSRLPGAVKPVAAPVQLENPFLGQLLDASRLVRMREARCRFDVDGTGTAIAILDTGLRATHRDFAGRVAAQRNFTRDNGADPEDAADLHGHGTAVAGTLCADGIHLGAAPSARIVPLKVLDNEGKGNFADVAAALQWVIDNHSALEITAVCMAFGNGGNYRSDTPFAADSVGDRLDVLAAMGIACCAAAGDEYYPHGSIQGMAYPAILRETLSVGAVYGGDVGPFPHPSGAEAYETEADRVAAFSQRLHEKVGRECATTVFAPGGPAISSGIMNDSGTSLQYGTSQATPLAAGLVLLLQSLHLRATGRLPMIADLRRWLARGTVSITDCDDEHDNVLHTGLSFRRLDAVAALECCVGDLARSAVSGRYPARPDHGPIERHSDGAGRTSRQACVCASRGAPSPSATPKGG
jgi:subtilisin family serine protease